MEWASKVSERHFASEYFHVVFTLPHELNSIVKRFPVELLGLLSKCGAATLLHFAAKPKYLDGTPFLMTVLHTWTQDLKFHPHLHCLISSGALSQDLSRWNQPKNKNFLFPTRTLARHFREIFLDGLEILIQSGKVQLPEE